MLERMSNACQYEDVNVVFDKRKQMLKRMSNVCQYVDVNDCV